ncbi:MAG: esterase family protein [Muribaculaceae bacterium]|nr:esterase family protein [Muribaculaceae bacterium]
MKRFLLSLAAAVCLACASASTTDTLTVATKHLDTPMRVTVITPDGAPGERFPSVYVLNGFGGGYRDWTKRVPQIADLADQYKMVIVMPDGRDSWYWDSPVDPGMQMESFFVEDLVPYVDSVLPTIPNRENRAITGLSMGGHGSFWLATRHPELWGSAGSMSGGVDIRPFGKNWKMAKNLGKTIDEDPELWETHTVATLVPLMKDANVNYTFDCGAEDFFAQVNAELHQAMLDAGVPHDYTSRPGNHSWPYWSNSIPYHLLYFSTKFTRE